MLNFVFLKRGLGLVSSPHFVHDFTTKIYLMLKSINWPNFIVSFPLLLEIYGNMCIVMVCYPVCDRGVATGGARGPWLPHFNFRTKQGPKVSVSNITDIAFYGCSEIIQDQKFHNFYRVCYNFWTIYGGFSFFLTT